MATKVRVDVSLQKKIELLDRIKKATPRLGLRALADDEKINPDKMSKSTIARLIKSEETLRDPPSAYATSRPKLDGLVLVHELAIFSLSRRTCIIFQSF